MAVLCFISLVIFLSLGSRAERAVLNDLDVDEQKGVLFGLQETLHEVPYLAEDIRAYERGDKEHRYHLPDRNRFPDEYKSWPRPTTVFTDYWTYGRWIPPIYGWDDDFWIAGGLDTWSGIQDSKKSQPTPIRLLAFPKAHIYNAVSLTPENVDIIPRMKEAFLWQWNTNSTFRSLCVDYALRLTQDDSLNPRYEDQGGLPNKQAALMQWKHFVHELRKLMPEECLWHFEFHLFRSNTVPHLHMHIYLINQQFLHWASETNLAKYRADHLHIAADVVYDFVRHHGAMLDIQA